MFNRETLQVHFGDVFERTHLPNQLYIMTQLMHGQNGFISNRILNRTPGLEVISYGGGTLGIEDIERMVGRWDLPNIKRAIEAGFPIFWDIEAPEEILEQFLQSTLALLEQEALKPPLTLSRL